MALYTYSDFENAAKSLGHFDTLSKADINLAKSNPDAGMSLLKYVNDYSLETNTSKQKQIENSINNLRQTYGGYKVVNGQLQLTSPTATNFNYVSPYADRISALTDAIAQRQPFSFDTEKDPSAQAAKKSYMRESRRATEDAIATASAMTGGIPSSYAVTAGTQAGDYHASQFADKIQALENAAYNRYLNENSLKQSELDSLLQRESNEKNAAYTEHMNRVNGKEGGISYSNYNTSNKAIGSILNVLPKPDKTETPSTSAPPSETLPPETEPQGGSSAGNSSVGGDIASQLPVPDDTPASLSGTTEEPKQSPSSDPDQFQDLTEQEQNTAIYKHLHYNGIRVYDEIEYQKAKDQGRTPYNTYNEYLNSLLNYYKEG